MNHENEGLVWLRQRLAWERVLDRLRQAHSAHSVDHGDTEAA